MSLLLKEQDVLNYSKNNRLTYKEGTSIIAIKMSWFNVYNMQYIMLNFNDDGITMIGMNNITGKLEENNFLVINKNDIQNIEFKKRILCYKMILNTTDTKYVYRINKKILGAKFHSTNFKRILAYFE